MIKFMFRKDKNDDELYHESMQNAYILVTDKLAFNDLFEYNGCSLPFLPKKKVDDKVFNKLIDYFCTLEEYEKCAELKKLKESKKYSKNFLNL